MTLSNEQLGRNEQQDIFLRVPEIDQKIQDLLRGFREDSDFLYQFLVFAGNFVVNNRSIPDSRTFEEKENQKNEVIRSIQLASSGVELAKKIRGIYAQTLSQEEITTTPEQRVMDLFALIQESKAKIIMSMFGMD